jgi:1-acyl-sn-glycerol-3-phosphate acyltransferase
MSAETISDWVGLLHTKKLEDTWFRLAEGIQKYFRVEVEGLENIPNEGPVIVAPNHSGYSGFDAIILAHLLRAKAGRVPNIMAHRAYFDWSSCLKLISQSFGLRRAGVQNGVQTLNEGNLLILFPEGESGNFKASSQKYQLQRFHSGFVRMSHATQSPIVPCVIIGAEESFLNFGNLDFTQYVKGLKIPLPFNWFPFPAKWKIKFLKPIYPSTPNAQLPDPHSDVEEACRNFQYWMQIHIDYELKKRPYIYFPMF